MSLEFGVILLMSLIGLKFSRKLVAFYIKLESTPKLTKKEDKSSS